jgi:predicted lipoprotein with Yx(FWY)xxD motif
LNDCATKWPPVTAPSDAKPFGDWSVIERPDNTRQWAFRGAPLYRYAKDAYAGAEFGERPEVDLWRVATKLMDLPPDVSVARTLIGTVLADATGMTLYTFDGDKVSEQPARVASNDPKATAPVRYEVKSRCTGSCQDAWHPLEAPWIAIAMEGWSVVTREDRTKQWAYRGKPLYRYGRDAKAGDVKGEAAKAGGSVWHVAMLDPAPPMPAWVRLQSTDGGEVAADAKGMTLYGFEAEKNVNRPSGGASERGCNQYCLDLYVPVLAAGEAPHVGDWATVATADGKKQWAYKGLPLYTFKEDKVPGDIVGTKPYRVWHTISRSGIPMQGAGGG